MTAPAVDVPALRAFIEAHHIPGIDRVTEHGSRRWLAGPELVCLDWRRIPPTQHPRAVAWLGLDRDPSAAATALADDPILGPLIRSRPGLVVPGAADVFETAVMAVLGQQVSLAAARTFAGRLVAAYARPQGDVVLFPSPSVLAVADPVQLQAAVGVTHARARTVVALAIAVANGLDLGETGSRADLLTVPGIGAWTADYVDLRCRRDPDAFLPGDLVVRRALGGRSISEVTDLARSWRPHRAYALLQLWTAFALLPAGRHD